MQELQSVKSIADPAVFDQTVLPGDELQNGWRDYLRIIRRHARFIVWFGIATVTVTASVVFLLMTPLYTAETTLLINRTPQQLLDLPEAAMASEQLPDADHDYYKTQSEILQSRDLASSVILEEKLAQNPYFIKSTKPLLPKWADKIIFALSSYFATPVPSWVTKPPVDPKFVDFYLDSVLKIQPVLQTQLISLEVRTADPDLSARIANAHAQGFIHEIQRLRTTTSAEGQAFLEKRLDELRHRIEHSEAALNQYTRANGLLGMEEKDGDHQENSLVMERLSDLQKYLTQAEADRIGLDAQVALIRDHNYDALPGVMDNELIQQLKGQEASLAATEAGLATQFTTDYPRLAQAHAQVVKVKEELGVQLNKIVAEAKSAHAAAVTKEEALRGAYAAQKTEALALGDAALEYGILSREVNTNRGLYKILLERMKQLGMATQLPTSGVSIVDMATAPIKPSRPKKLLSLLISLLAGLTLGTAMAFAFESMDTTFKSVDEIETFLRLPTLTEIPDFSTLLTMRESGREPLALESALPTMPASSSLAATSLAVEGYHALCTSITLSRAERPPQTLLFTSAAPGEGKTLNAINTAASFARLGARVLLIDADLRRSACHGPLRMDNQKGLADVLVSQAELGEVIQSTMIPNLSLLSSGSAAPNPVTLIRSLKMTQILDVLRTQFEYIILDTCPAYHLSEPLLLSTLVDGVLLVLNGPVTPRELVKTTTIRLQRHHANLLGVVLNRVTLNHRSYGYPKQIDSRF